MTTIYFTKLGYITALNHLNYYPVSNGDKVYVGEKADPILICAYGAETDNVYLIRNDAEVIPSKKDQV